MSVITLHIGFTGSQHGMSDQQMARLRTLLPAPPFALHHGDCIGADAQAHDIVKELGGEVLLHPPVYAAKRAFCEATAVHPPLPYMVRNQRIVDSGTGGLIATPFDKEARSPRSGTWATVRMARRAGRFIAIIERDGSVIGENGPCRW